MCTILGHIYTSEETKAHQHANGRIISLISTLGSITHQAFFVDHFTVFLCLCRGQRTSSPFFLTIKILWWPRNLWWYSVWCRGEKFKLKKFGKDRSASRNSSLANLDLWETDLQYRMWLLLWSHRFLLSNKPRGVDSVVGFPAKNLVNTELNFPDAIA